MESSSHARAGEGWFTFAGVMFVIAGAANLLWGIAALDKKDYLPEAGLLFGSLTFWGWISILWAVGALVVGYLVLNRSAMGVGFGILMAMLSAIFWLFALPVLPIWSLVIILIDVLIIYGLAEHGHLARSSR
jgi:hypothetical protein